MIDTKEKVARALELAELGFRLFPLAAGSKVPPKGLAWKDEATADPLKIKEWFESDPAMNYGVATGAGAIVLDVDTKGGKPGLSSLEALEIGFDLPESYRVETPSGGVHVYLKVSEQHRNRVDSIPDFPAIDVRADGGYVVGPGSVVGGKTYVARPGPIAPAGPGVEQLLLRSAPDHSLATSKEPIVELDLPAHVDMAIEYLANRAPEATEGAGGNETTYQVAARCREYGLSQEKTLDVMLDHWNEQKAFPAWLPADLQTVVANAYKYATGAWGGGTPAGEFEPVDLGEDETPPKSSKAPKWVFETIGDLRRLPPVKWLVKDWIPENSSGIVYGKWGSGKSFLMFDLAFHLAYGMGHWHGAALPGEPKRVLVLAREGHQGFTARADAFKRFRQIDEDQEGLVFMRTPISFLDDQQFKSFAAALAKQEPGFDLILVDTVARVLPGMDMSTPENITKFTERCAELTQATGATTIGVHHQNKGGSIYGSVFFEANSDFVFKVEKTGGEEAPLKQGTVACTKMKDGEDGWKKFLRYEKVALGHGPGAGSSLVVAEISGTAGANQLGEALEVIRKAHLAGKALSKHPRARESGRYGAEHVASALRIDEKPAAALLDELLRQGFISEEQDRKTKSKFLAPTFAAVEIEAAETGGDVAETGTVEAA